MLGKKGRPDDIDRLVCKRLKTKRIMLGLTQAELAKAINVSIPQIQKYEKGINRISSGRLYKFAEILKIPINYFFVLNDNANNIISNPTNILFSEDSKTDVTEREICSLIKYFSKIKNYEVRKKMTEFIKIIN